MYLHLEELCQIMKQELIKLEEKLFVKYSKFMSKLGKKPIVIPKDTTVKIETGKLIVKGPKGSRELNINDKIFSTTISKDNNLILRLINKNEKANIMWGTTRSLLNSAVLGVSIGFERILELSGVGFRAAIKGEMLSLQLGFSHDVNYKIPKDIKPYSRKTNYN